jgi:hypothetical protein
MIGRGILLKIEIQATVSRLWWIEPLLNFLSKTITSRSILVIESKSYSTNVSFSRCYYISPSQDVKEVLGVSLLPVITKHRQVPD